MLPITNKINWREVGFWKMGRRTWNRFVRYALVGTATFPLDLGILYALVFYLSVNYLWATFLAFLISVSVNYYFTRPWAFHGTRRGFWGGYLFFALLGTGAASLTTLSTALLVSYFEIHFLYARVAVGAFIGILGFFINLYINFRVGESQEAS